jgi:Lar family restriction alleviation protein
MRQLGEQWVEELDGKKHMLKAVPPIHLCSGCVFSNKALCSDPMMSERDIDCSKMIVKDLGVLNENGVLPCPFCGSYPELFTTFWRNASAISCTSCGCTSDDEYKSLQQAIDAWNRRA